MSDEPKVAAPSGTEPIKVSFDWDGSGSAALARYILDSEPELATVGRRVRRVRVLSVLLWGPPVIFVTQACVRQITLGADGGDVMGWLLGSMFVVLGLLFTLSQVGAWGAFRIKLLERAGRIPRQETVRLTVTADVQGITTADDDRVVTHRWKNFDQVIRIPDFIAVIFSNAGSGVTIPLSAFGSSEAADAFEIGLRRLLISSGFERTDRIRAMLAQYSVLCGGCGHDLRGLMEPQCPECGRQFTVLSLTIFRALQMSWWKLAAIRQRKPYVTDERSL